MVLPFPELAKWVWAGIGEWQDQSIRKCIWGNTVSLSSSRALGREGSWVGKSGVVGKDGAGSYR